MDPRGHLAQALGLLASLTLEPPKLKIFLEARVPNMLCYGYNIKVSEQAEKCFVGQGSNYKFWRVPISWPVHKGTGPCFILKNALKSRIFAEIEGKGNCLHSLRLSAVAAPENFLWGASRGKNTFLRGQKSKKLQKMADFGHFFLLTGGGQSLVQFLYHGSFFFFYFISHPTV